MTTDKRRLWTPQEEDYLRENWGLKSIPTIAKALNRSEKAIQNKRDKMKLGGSVAASGFISLNSLLGVLYGDPDHGNRMFSHKKRAWKENGLRIVHKKVNRASVNCVSIDHFWEWAEKHQNLVNLAHMQEGALGAEPSWAKEKRRLDIENGGHVRRDWTKGEESQLRGMLKSYRYTCAEIAAAVGRSESAVRRHIYEMGLKESPVYLQCRRWTEDELLALARLREQGYGASTIAKRIDRPVSSVYRRLNLLQEQEIV